MLGIEVEYLTGKVYAGIDRGPTSEYPPHLARLFAALTAACHEATLGEAGFNALRWLEQQPPPCIWAPDEGVSEIGLAFVPTNYMGEDGNLLPQHRKRQPRYFPSLTPHPPLVYFIWPEAEPEEQIRAALDHVAQHVGYLGKATSLVRMRAVDQAPEPNYVPDNYGKYGIRVVGPGTLALLEWRHQTCRWEPSEMPRQRYSKVDELRRPAIEGPFSEMVILRRTEGAALSAEGTLTLTQAARKAVLKIAGDYGLLTPLLHGHQDGPHCAWLGLPFTGREYADGRLLGLALAIPRGASGPERRKVRAAASLAEQIHLPAPLAPWKVEPADANVHGHTLRAETWSRASKCWSSVTPVLLDRFPKRKLSTEQILAGACQRLRLPEPEEIRHGPYSPVKGVAPVPAFRLLRRPGDRPRWGVHVRLRFNRPVQGPLVLGAGRYFGLGLLRPIPEDAWN